MSNSYNITHTQLRSIMVDAKAPNIQKFLPFINSTMRKFNITTPLQQAHFLAQVGHECGSFNYLVESLNYSAAGLRKIFPKHFKTNAEMESFARKPEKIANRVYSNRLGNGSEESGDGWKYRGRGMIQLTGKDVYREFASASGSQVLSDPDRLATDPRLCAESAGWFWKRANLNQLADKDDVEAVTRRINGGVNGLDDRKAYLRRSKLALGITR
ncbi:glycosyl hydrolase family 19 domain-containing protein HI_1415-like [Oratosquilla oratoria]|uniref:glycosyl hydrolase family 19 domain-containing protein HI_1415-like n=1 Tax=Oratosquilla oratoria TaxID=337810 RepID=UPI003F7666E9